MSEPENFLSRWSRRKRESEPEPKVAAAEPPSDASEQAAPATTERHQPTFDLSGLPSLDEIGGGSDLSMFMHPGVPSAIRHAALRRAWVSDPAVRDFRGLQENDWDFTTPDNVPGFGTFKSQSEIKEIAKRLFGPDTDEQAATAQTVSPNGERRLPLKAPASSDEPPTEHGSSQDPLDKQSDSARFTAMQHEEEASKKPNVARRHGGALPR